MSRYLPRRVEFGGDVVVAVTFHFPAGHVLQMRVAQQGQEAFILLGHLGGKFRRRLLPEQPVETPQARTAAWPGERTLLHNGAAALLAVLVLDEVACLASRDDHQQRPESGPAEQVTELAGLGALAEAVKGAQRDILFIRRPPWPALQFFAGQADQTLKIAFPKAPRRLGVARLELTNPLSHRVLGGHGRFPLRIGSLP
jgi:hypothetical protein